MKLFKITIIVAVLLLVTKADAQVAPEIVLTWKAGSYAPPAYNGKVLPSENSNVEIGLEMLEAGKFANLSSVVIRWDVNNELYRSGAGLKNISLVIDRAKGDPIIAASFTYKGRPYDKRIIIPVAKPDVSITGGPDSFRAFLYFFNIASPAQAKFTWSANGIATEGQGERPDILNIDTDAPSGSALNISVRAQSLIRELEIASRSITYTK